MDDVIIMAAALSVSTPVCPRNRCAGHSHRLRGHDHKPPLDILTEARWQLTRYPAIKLVSARADSAFGAIGNFSVLTGDGESLAARRLILSYGVADQMPMLQSARKLGSRHPAWNIQADPARRQIPLVDGRIVDICPSTHIALPI